jgi:broad specificity phosphatase PhoE
VNPTIESVILIRHATSTANHDPSVYLRVPDHAIPLARPDDDPDAHAAGDALGKLGLDPGQVCSWFSTYLRCQQTECLVMARAFGARVREVNQRESFLLREQEFGDWDGLTEEQMRAKDPERYERRRLFSDSLGRFYFRYPSGESRADVVQRMAIFLSKVHRSRYLHHVVFLHGVTQRAFRMAWFNRGPVWFETEPNPRNGSVLQIYRDGTCQWQERWLTRKPSTSS